MPSTLFFDDLLIDYTYKVPVTYLNTIVKSQGTSELPRIINNVTEGKVIFGDLPNEILKLLEEYPVNIIGSYSQKTKPSSLCLTSDGKWCSFESPIPIDLPNLSLDECKKLHRFERTYSYIIEFPLSVITTDTYFVLATEIGKLLIWCGSIIPLSSTYIDYEEEFTNGSSIELIRDYINANYNAYKFTATVEGTKLILHSTSLSVDFIKFSSFNLGISLDYIWNNQVMYSKLEPDIVLILSSKLLGTQSNNYYLQFFDSYLELKYSNIVIERYEFNEFFVKCNNHSKYLNIEFYESFPNITNSIIYLLNGEALVNSIENSISKFDYTNAIVYIPYELNSIEIGIIKTVLERDRSICIVNGDGTDYPELFLFTTGSVIDNAILFPKAYLYIQNFLKQYYFGLNPNISFVDNNDAIFIYSYIVNLNTEFLFNFIVSRLTYHLKDYPFQERDIFKILQTCSKFSFVVNMNLESQENLDLTTQSITIKTSIKLAREFIKRVTFIIKI